DDKAAVGLGVDHGGQRPAFTKWDDVARADETWQCSLHAGMVLTHRAACYGASVNRTDRLYALVEELRGHAPQTVRASELAERFEVTTRTIERDLLALQEAGVPIWAQPGPGGGYGLNVDTTLPPLNLTPAEAAAIATALAATRAMPFA